MLEPPATEEAEVGRWPAPTLPFQVSLVTVYRARRGHVGPAAPHLRDRLAAAYVMTTVQLVVLPVPVLVTLTWPWKPPGQLLI